MRKVFIILSLFSICGICAAQNTADKYLKDAKKALAEKHYNQAQKLAAVYNKLTESNRGDAIIKEAQAHIQCDSLINIADIAVDQFNQYPSALTNYVTAYGMFKDESLYPKIKKCSEAIIKNSVEVSSDPEMAQKLYQIHLDSSKSVEQNICILQVAALYGHGLAADHVGYLLMGKKEYEAAIKYYDIARSAHRDVSNNMGSCYTSLAYNASDSSTKNKYLKKAYELFLEAANNNNRIGQYNVGICLLDGKGVTRDFDSAMEWLKKSSNNGYEKAKEKLAELEKEIPQKLVDKNTITVTGHVRDSKEPLIGVAIVLDNQSNVGTCTGLDGDYTLKNVPSDGVLVFECIGYYSQRVSINGRNTIDVTLKERPGHFEALFDDDPIVGVGLVSDFNKFPIGIRGDFMWGLIHVGFDLSTGSNLFISKAYSFSSSSAVVTVNGVPVEPTITLIDSGEEKTRGVFAYTITPGLFYKYVSLDCGLGQIWTKTSRIETYEYKYESSSSSGEGNTSISTSSSNRIEKKLVETNNSFFVFKPGVSGVIGDTDVFAVVLSARYRICPKEKSLNGFEVSVGITIPL